MMTKPYLLNAKLKNIDPNPNPTTNRITNRGGLSEWRANTEFACYHDRSVGCCCSCSCSGV